jgi:hypothetical protein
MSIHERINARSWYHGDLLRFDRVIKVVGGTIYKTPERMRIDTPDLYHLPTDRPRRPGQFYQPAIPKTKTIQLCNGLLK